MRTIHLDPDLRVRFPRRSRDFDEGVEIGVAAALMARGEPTISRWLAADSIEQFRSLAGKFNYRVTIDANDGELQHAVASRVALKPRLRLVR